ncbi:MAG: GNAT family N-acetyltransferase [Candidatus Helarchaeota archaeon]
MSATQSKDLFKPFTLSPLSTANLSAVHKFLLQNEPFYHIPLEFFRRGTLGDEGFDPELSLILTDSETDTPIAAIIAVIKKGFVKTNCYLKVCLVAKEYRQQGIGSKLLQELITRAKQKLPWYAYIYYGDCPPRYWQPGVDLRHTSLFFFLKKSGFKPHGLRYNLTCHIPSQFPQPREELAGYTFSRVTPNEYESLVSFIHRHFRLGFWSKEVPLSFENSPPTTFLAKDQEEAIVGWATHSAHFPGSFGPTGVKKTLRGKGIGSELLRWTIWDMHQQGIDTCTILWVVGDTRKYYSKVLNAYIHPIFAPMGRRL